MSIRGFNVFVSYSDPLQYSDLDKMVVEEIETRGGVVTEFGWDNGTRSIRGFFEQSKSPNDTAWAKLASDFCAEALEKQGFTANVCEVVELVGKVQESQEGQNGPIKRYGYNIFITTGSACVDEARTIIENCGGRVYDVEPIDNGHTSKMRGYFQALAGCALAEKAAKICHEQLLEAGYTLSEFKEWPEGSCIMDDLPPEFQGRVENVKVFDRALSREEIEQDFARQKADIDEIDRIAVGAMFGIMVGDFLEGITSATIREPDEDDERADAEAVIAAIEESARLNFYRDSLGVPYGTGPQTPNPRDQAMNENFAAIYGRPGSTGPDPNGPNPDHNPTDDFIAGVEHEAWSDGWDEGFDTGYDEGYEAAEIDLKHEVNEVVEAANNVVDSATRLIFSAELNDGTDEREEAFDKGFSAGVESAEATASAARTSVAEEIALARTTVQTILDRCKTGEELAKAAPEINDLLETINDLVYQESVPAYDRGFNDGTEYGMELADDIDGEFEEDDEEDDLLDSLEEEYDWSDDDWDDDEDEYEEGYDDGFEDGEEDGFKEGYYAGANEGVEQGRKDLLAELVADPQRALALYRLAVASVPDAE